MLPVLCLGYPGFFWAYLLCEESLLSIRYTVPVTQPERRPTDWPVLRHTSTGNYKGGQVVKDHGTRSQQSVYFSKQQSAQILGLGSED